jgi:hypothetical protein
MRVNEYASYSRAWPSRPQPGDVADFGERRRKLGVRIVSSGVSRSAETSHPIATTT